ncbi:MAG: serine hydrolase domain-containing protein [Candidatus Thorarchaeota archaeon]
MSSSLKILTALMMLCLLSALLPTTEVRNIALERNHIPASERDYWPTNGWRNSTPEEQGMDSARLQEMIDYIEDNRVAIHSVVVIKNGYKVLEEYPTGLYDAGSTHLLYSVTKSFTSALVGIAIDKGYIDNVSIPMLSYFPEYNITNEDPRRERITIEHLLQMRSGLFWDENSAPYTSPANGVYHINTGDGVEFMLNADMVAEPGTLWHYNTGGSHLLSAIVQVATGMSTLEFAEENLFDPLNISPAFWSRDLAGWYKGGYDLRMTTLSMAKFGFLFLNNGTWDGDQIISEEWVQTSTSTITQVDSYTGYGYQWWTTPQLGIYSARGLYGQYIFVIPEHDIVVAFSSNIRSGAYPHEDLVASFIIPQEGSQNNQDLVSSILTFGTAIVLIVPVALAGGYWVFILRRRTPQT